MTSEKWRKKEEEALKREFYTGAVTRALMPGRHSSALIPKFSRFNVISARLCNRRSMHPTAPSSVLKLVGQVFTLGGLLGLFV
jgi:hypothetical protein